ncbi:CBD9-like protein, partial [Massarina eburnea CBS 473.64]
SAHAQQTETFTDPLTQITFQRFFGAKSQFAFGIALPENPSTDFIGQISCPMPSRAGWAGIALQEDMEGPLLLTAWPNGDSVVSSFRIAKNEDDSPPIVRGGFSVAQIDQGTVVNDTHMTWTFLCKGCVGNSKTSFTAQDTAGSFSMGWALADRAVSNAADPAAILPFHNKGMSSF